jgi:tetratricopeptide (TPR) repeat protein
MRAIELDPSVADFWRWRAMHRINSGDPDGAIAVATHAIELDPNGAWGWGRRGNAFLNKGDIDASARDLERAIELDPTEYWFWSYRATIKLHRSDWRGAIADLDEAVRLEPHCYGTVYMNRGIAHVRLDERALGIADFERALDAELDDGSRAQVGDWLTRLRAQKR